MKLSLKYFLIICLLLGGIAIPTGFGWYQSWKEYEVERLKAELDELYMNEPFDIRMVKGTMIEEWNPGYDNWINHVGQLESRIERLTGKRPSSPFHDLDRYYEVFQGSGTAQALRSCTSMLKHRRACAGLRPSATLNTGRARIKATGRLRPSATTRKLRPDEALFF